MELLLSEPPIFSFVMYCYGYNFCVQDKGRFEIEVFKLNVGVFEPRFWI